MDLARVEAAASSQCPVCEGTARLLDRLDFNKSCEEPRGKVLPRSGTLIDYQLCERCGFCFAPQFRDWDQAQFEQRIYNKDYASVDPDYLDARPRANAAALVSLIGDHGKTISHLDYGGGTGLLSRLLQDAKWKSGSYDPFSDRDVAIESLGRYDLITAFEVFEHVPDVQRLMSNLASLLERPGLILFSTLLSDGHVEPDKPLDWWYAAPRNGHVSLFSRRSLAVLGNTHGYSFGSLTDNFHAYWKEIPDWAPAPFQSLA
jgi:SAM-dependent methyltransferase